MDFTKKFFAVVTGASQGIGRAIAIELSKRLCDGSSIMLIARNVQALKEVKSTILSGANVSVQVVELDLSNASPADFQSIFSVSSVYDHALIFHNAGQIGAINRAIELTDAQKWRNYFDLHLFSLAILNSIFVKSVRGFVSNSITVVNISSLCGREPFPNLAMYGTAKAARDIYFKVLAVEESDVNVLNYCPGPVETAMVEEILADENSEDTKKIFVDLKEKDMLLSPVITVQKLLNILQKGDFTSGDVIDYYDRP